jgi:AcrR family transcriptional regulator
MTRGFDENEKEAIRNTLIKKGKELFIRYGLKKTGIGDLTKAVGIAQGSFYTFYDSKEELFFDIMQNEEEEFQQKSAELLAREGFTRDTLKKLLGNAFAYMDNNPVINMIYSGDIYEKLVRKLSKEKLDNHMQNDAGYLLPVIKKLQQEGKVINVKPEVIIGMFRSFFALPLHRKEIGESVYNEVIDLVVDITVKGIFDEE